MALTDAHKTDFNTLVKAIKAGDVALIEHELAATGERMPVVCTAVEVSCGNVQFFPFAMIFSGNPYKLIRPMRGGGDFHPQQESRT